MLMDNEELCRLIPHTGRMCLLDGVLRWDSEEISCITNSHLDPDNPLRRDGRLAAVHLLEYGAQAMGVHGGLIARESGTRITSGYLARARDITLAVEFLDDITCSLEIHARKIASSLGGFMYLFYITAATQLLASGQATVITESGDSI